MCQLWNWKQLWAPRRVNTASDSLLLEWLFLCKIYFWSLPDSKHILRHFQEVPDKGQVPVANGQSWPNCLWEGGELAQSQERDIALYKQEWNRILASLVGGTDWSKCKHFTQTTEQLTPHHWPGLDFSLHSRWEKKNKPKNTSNNTLPFLVLYFSLCMQNIKLTFLVHVLRIFIYCRLPSASF